MFKAIKKTLLESSPLPKELIIYSKIHSRVLDLKSMIGNYLDADDDINQHDVIVLHGNVPKFKRVVMLSSSSIHNILMTLISI